MLHHDCRSVRKRSFLLSSAWSFSSAWWFAAAWFLWLLHQHLTVEGFSAPGSSSSTVRPDTPRTPSTSTSTTSTSASTNAVHNSELIGSLGFHHVEFYCGDAKSTAHRFSLALGMPITCATHQGTGNDRCCSYGLESGDVRFLLTAPYSHQVSSSSSSSSGDDDDGFDAPGPLPSFSNEGAHAFFRRHGLGVRAVGVEVRDAGSAFATAVARGATPVCEPVRVEACAGQTRDQVGAVGCTMAEVELYGDVVLRFLTMDETTSSSSSYRPFLPHLVAQPPKRTAARTYGLRRIDHAVGNVPDLMETLQRVAAFTGFHEFAEFTADDVGTVESGLNSVVLASDSERILLPINEPTRGQRKSQIQTFLEQNEGPGLQHLALKTDDIFYTIDKMRTAEEELGGFELMVRPSDNYYRELPDRLGDRLTREQYQQVEELGILADYDQEGVLLQIFTKPVGDRPTFFIEIIQRIGCESSSTQDELNDVDNAYSQRPGCGGFGQGNFKELFKAIEDHEKTLKI